MIRLDYRDARPIYEQVRDGLRSLMVTGVLAAGEKLPSVRSLATELAINPNTIQRAYSQLETEGYVYTVSGRGTFRPGAAPDGGAAGPGHDPGGMDGPLERRGQRCLRQKTW